MEIMEERNTEHFMLFLEISKSLSLIATLKCVIYPHFTNAETDSESPNYLLQITKAVK